jgi:hypothetical protein
MTMLVPRRTRRRGYSESLAAYTCRPMELSTMPRVGAPRDGSPTVSAYPCSRSSASTRYVATRLDSVVRFVSSRRSASSWSTRRAPNPANKRTLRARRRRAGVVTWPKRGLGPSPLGRAITRTSGAVTELVTVSVSTRSPGSRDVEAGILAVDPNKGPGCYERCPDRRRTHFRSSDQDAEAVASRQRIRDSLA